MKDIFHLKENRANALTEIVSGITTFLAVCYTLTVTPAILQDAGMPFGGVFAASALTAAFCTIMMALVANTPFAIAPGMGLNSFFAHTICLGLGFHWREALAVVFFSSIIHVIVMTTRIREAVIDAFPNSLKYATSVGIGLFISFIGMKNAGLLSFTISPGSYRVTDSGMVLADSNAYPSLIGHFGASHLVVLVGLVATLFLLGLEKRTGDRYAPFLLGIVAATFIGIPLDITNVTEVQFVDYSALGELRHVFLAFLGDPGILSLAASPARLATAVALCLVLSLTDVIDSFASIIGTGSLPANQLFDASGTASDNAPDTYREIPANRRTRSLISNSFSGIVSAIFGTSTSTAYIESVTGIASGGRTGLTSLTTGLLFLLCLPFVKLFTLIPGEALAPGLIISGLFLMSLVSKIDWSEQEEAIPAALTILFIATTYSVLNGVTAGFLSHILLQVAHGKAARLKPALIIVTLALLVVALARNCLEVT